MPAGVNGVKEPSLLPIDPKRIIPPYLHLVLGLTNNVVQEMLADLTRLGCVDPAAARRQFEHCALLAELETCVAGAVDGLISVLPGRRYKTQVEQVVSAMEKVPAPAPPRARHRRRRCCCCSCCARSRSCARRARSCHRRRRRRCACCCGYSLGSCCSGWCRVRCTWADRQGELGLPRRRGYRNGCHGAWRRGKHR